MEESQIIIVGAGSWGTAMAQVLADNQHPVTLISRNPDQVQEINENHTNSKFFGELKIHEDIQCTDDFSCAENADIIVLAVPTQAIQATCVRLDEIIDHPVIIVNLSKGFHPETNQRMSEVIRETISSEHLSSVVSLIGPSHAEEVIERQLTSIDAISLNVEDAQTVQRLFSNEYLRIYTGHDEVGSEIGAALKNVMAIASGILAGLGYHDNTRAALITRGLQEMIRFGTYFGGHAKTFNGLTGIGDLIVTCSSVHSRNFQAGYQIGKDNSVTRFLNENTKTVEGIRTARIVHEIATSCHIDMPICEEVYQILYEGKEPSTCAKDLMLRDLKEEF